MKQWRMRTAMMVSLLAVSFGLTLTCLLIIRFSLQQEIRKGLNSDLKHSLNTFRNISQQRKQMLAREAALLADLPSLKALMASQDQRTIQDGGGQFFKVSGSDFFALTSPTGELFTYARHGPELGESIVRSGLKACMSSSDGPCLIAFGHDLYELSIQPLYFGPPANGSQLGYVVIGYSIDHQVALEVSEAAAADVAFLVNGEVSATTLSSNRLPDVRLLTSALNAEGQQPALIKLGREAYMALTLQLPSTEQARVHIVVLKSYDRASQYLRRVNQGVLALGLSALIIGLFLTNAISRNITRPLEALAAGSRALGQGDFNYRLSSEGAVEVRELAFAFDRMRGELKRTQGELLEADRLATIGRMASSVSHDLRHHLSAIYANAEFMSLRQTGQEERVELLLEVRDAVQDMTDLIESLLLFGQTGQVLQIRYESITQVIERTTHLVRQHPECRAVAISVGELPTVEACVDGPKLGRALYNLLLNACQAARTGASHTVSITLTEDSEMISISVEDSGPGVPRAIRDTLFQPFVSDGKENGVGLGLTLAQHIAQEHGGEVKLLESGPGRTTFSLLLYKQALALYSQAESTACTPDEPHKSAATGEPAAKLPAGPNQEQL